jgi:hypothetical protein
MKTLIILLALILPATAQGYMLPTTLPLVNNTTKEVIGTATLWGGKMVLRKQNGEFIATVTINKDGTRTLYDESGKVLDQLPGNVTVPEVK